MKLSAKKATLIDPDGNEHILSIREFANIIKKPYNTVSGLFYGSVLSYKEWRLKSTESRRITVAKLLKQYTDWENKTVKEIAAELNISVRSISRYLEKNPDIYKIVKKNSRKQKNYKSKIKKRFIDPDGNEHLLNYSELARKLNSSKVNVKNFFYEQTTIYKGWQHKNNPHKQRVLIEEQLNNFDEWENKTAREIAEKFKCTTAYIYIYLKNHPEKDKLLKRGSTEMIIVDSEQAEQIKHYSSKGFSARYISKKIGLTINVVKMFEPKRTSLTKELIDPDGNEHILTCHEFADKLKVPYNCVGNFFNEKTTIYKGWQHKNNPHKPRVLIEEKLENYQYWGTKSIREIAEEFNITAESVYTYLKKHPEIDATVLKNYKLRNSDCKEFIFESVVDFINTVGFTKTNDRTGIHKLLKGESYYYKGWYNPDKVPLEDHRHKETIFEMYRNGDSVPSVAGKLNIPYNVARYYRMLFNRTENEV